MFKRIRTYVNRLSIRKKLLTVFLLFGMLPIILLSMFFYSVSRNIILNNVSANLQSLVAKNNELIAVQFERIEDASLMLTVNGILSDLINRPTPPDRLELLHGNLAIKRVLDQYFLGIDGVFSYHLYTDYYMMVGNIADPTIPNSKPAMYVPYEEFNTSALNHKAVEAGGKLVWCPTYHYDTMYGLKQYQEIAYNHPYLFSAVKQINCLSDPTEGRFEPIVIVSFQPTFIDNIIKDSSMDEQDMCSYMVSQDMQIIYDYSDERLTQGLPSELAQAIEGNRGSVRLNYRNQDCLMVYDTLENIGWKQILVVPMMVYTRSMTTLPELLLLVSLLLTLGLSVLVCLTTNRITRSLEIVINGMARLGDGEFMIHLPEPEDSEFAFLAQRFNEMDERIHSLIVENYEIELRQKEAQIMALNLQLNPHFLYNTLSTINWMAIDAGQVEISEALYRLSQMLQQSFRNKSDLCTVRDDLHWLDDYLYIMNLRFEGRFTVSMNIEEALMPTLIPRSMFQPILENTIAHGFQDIEHGGRIVMTGTFQPDRSRLFCISDNGSGFDPNRIPAMLQTESEGVGLSNLNHRLQILFKDSYRLRIETAIGKGTVVMIQLPPDERSV